MRSYNPGFGPGVFVVRLIRIRRHPFGPRSEFSTSVVDPDPGSGAFRSLDINPGYQVFPDLSSISVLG
jgi:hypothetical protein